MMKSLSYLWWIVTEYIDMDRIEVETKVSEDDFVKVNYFFLYSTKMIWVLSLVGVLTIVFVTLGLSEIYGLPIGLAMIFLFPTLRIRDVSLLLAPEILTNST